jgi:type II secretion system protein N
VAIIEKVKSLKQYPKYLALGAAVFVLGLFWHFPLERFASSITSIIKKNSGWTVTVEDISLGFPIGIVFSKGMIQPPDAATGIPFDRLKIRPAMAFHFQKPFFTLAFSGNTAKQKWSGSVFGGEDFKMDLNIKNFDFKGSFPLDANPMLAGQVIDVDTVVNLDLSLAGKMVAIQQQNFSEATGSLEITSKKLDLVVPMLKALNFTNVDVDLNLKKGLLSLKNVELKSTKLSANGTGEIKIEPFFPNSKLQLDAKIKGDMQDPEIQMNLPLVTSLLGLPPSTDGNLNLKINGALNSPERLSIRGQ